MLLFFAGLLCAKTIVAIHIAPGEDIPKQHATELQRMLLTLLGRSADLDGGSIINYLMGNSSGLQAGDLTKLNLDVLDLESLDKIVKIIGRKEAEEEKVKKKAVISRRTLPKKSLTDKQNRGHPYGDVEITRILHSMIYQTVYATRFTLQRTKKYRRMYAGNHYYLLGTLYGSLMQMKYKMENLYTTMMKFHTKGSKKVNTHWFLMAYTKILATHIDIRYIVQRMFQINIKLSKVLETKVHVDEYGGKPNL